MKVLFIGGTGIISSACSPLAIERGIDLYLLNRGKTTHRPIPEGAKVLHGDIRDPQSARTALEGQTFDAVVDWVAFTPEHIQTDLELFKGRTGQYIFISSASVYQTPPAHLPVTESTLLDNPFWLYSQNKIACEEMLVRAYREDKFPMTIVRPSHTYDKTLLPMDGGFTVVNRMRQGKKVIIPGDGTSLWVMTHHKDFAKGFVGLLGHSGAIGEAIHITSDEWLSWNQLFEIVARAAKAELKPVHVPSDLINAYDPNWGAGLLGDKANSMIFDNSKIKRLVPDFRTSIPYARGAEEVIAWYDADPARQKIDEKFDRLEDEIISRYEKAFP
ncbi:MAG: NAD-dependent epimerase/dehydratase family protein [Anaerolineaceae bacterium]|nr:NAD-dependent epimerase/dehydratase family protein [Anaerolineaceae bacterium]